MKLQIVLIFFLHVTLFSDENAALYFHGNCTTCHFDSKAVSAPSVMELKKRYLEAFSKKEDFVTYMSTWIYKPSAEMSIMQDAIEEYELMPELAYDLETLRIISEYIYETDFNSTHPNLK